MYEATGGFGAAAHRSPQSPVTTKRRNPFGEVSPVYAKHGRTEPIDLEAVHQRTTQMLFNAQHLLSSGAMMVTEPEPSAQVGPCWTCRQTAQLNGCSFCSRNVCDGCVRQCAVCLDVFCTFCSSVSYEGSVDRNLCLSCLDEEMRRARELQRATANARRAAGVPATTGPAFAGAYLAPLAPFPII